MVKFNPRLKSDVLKYLNYAIIVEGENLIPKMNSLGFQEVYALHKDGVPLKERVEQIANQIDKKTKVCILTDLTKQGKNTYLQIKPLFDEQNVKLDSSLRGLLLKSGIRKIQELPEFMEQVNKI